jgi:hypothetical protein
MSTPGRTARSWCALILGALLGSAYDAEGQRLVISTFVPQVTSPRTQVLSLASGQEEFGLPGPIASGRTIFTADGRFALWQRELADGSRQLVAYDVLDRTLRPLPFDMEPLAAHPAVLAVFGLSQAAAVRLDVSGLHPLYDCAPSRLVDLDVSADGARVAALCATGVVGIVDATTGGLLHTVVAGAPQVVTSAHFDVSGSRLLVARRLPLQRPQLALVDVTSGQDVATADSPDAPVPPPFQPDPGCRVDVVSASRAMAVVACSWIVGPPHPMSIYVTRRVEVSTLAWGQRLDVRYNGGAMSLDPEATRLFAASTHIGAWVVQILDAVTGASLAEAPRVGAGIGVAYPPLVPTLSAVVTGTSVRLDWSVPAHSPLSVATVVEVGFGPGRVDLTTLPLDGVGLVADAVPAGRYFVRVRAMNYTGASPVSNEVVVDVP